MKFDEILRLPWNQINVQIKDMGEKDLAKLIEAERKGAKRPHILLRIHQRFNKVRADRERKEICS